MLDAVIYQPITALGDCSLKISLPLLQLMGLRTAPLANSVMTSSGAYPGLAANSSCGLLKDLARQLQKLQIEPRSLLAGYTRDLALYEEIQQFKQQFPACLVCVDPVLGDNGKMYGSLPAQALAAAVKLLKIADFVTPNATETQLLLGEKVGDWRTAAQKLQQLGAKNVLLKDWPAATDVGAGAGAGTEKNQSSGCNYFLSATGEQYTSTFARYGIGEVTAYSGTGDCFAALFWGTYLRTGDYRRAMEQAGKLTGLAVRVSNDFWRKQAAAGQTAGPYSLLWQHCLPVLAQELAGEGGDFQWMNLSAKR